MKKLLMLVATVAMVLTQALPAYAQQRELTVGALAEDSPSPPTYQVTKEGVLVIEGDVLTRCKSLPFDKLESQASREYVRACTEAGFPPKDTLPQTGGVPFLLVPVALLVAGGLFIRAVASRYARSAA